MPSTTAEFVVLEARECTDQGVGAKGVVHVDHPNALYPKRGQMGNGFFHLALVGRTDIEDVSLHGLVQHHGAGGRAHERHAEFVQQWNDAHGVRRAARHEQCQNAFVDDQRARVGKREFGIEFVVQGQHFDLLAVDTAARIHGVEVELRPAHRFLDGGRGRAAHAHRLPNEQLGVRPRQEAGEQDACRDKKFPCIHVGSLAEKDAVGGSPIRQRPKP